MKPSRECSEEVKAAAAGLVFASARLGELPELLDARGIFADKFGGDFARAAKEGSHGVVDPTVSSPSASPLTSLQLATFPQFTGQLHACVWWESCLRSVVGLLQLVSKLSGQRASEEERRRLVKEIAAENGILLDFHDKPVQIHQQVRKC